MCWIDFGIICIEQAEVALPEGMMDFRFEYYKRTVNSEPLYDNWYHFNTADKLPGYWYFIWMPCESRFDESFFDMTEKGCPWVCVKPKWKDTVKKILAFYIQQSPVHQIAVLLRIQSESRNAFHSYCTLDAFMDALMAGNIKWNELYFIEN